MPIAVATSGHTKNEISIIRRCHQCTRNPIVHAVSCGMQLTCSIDAPNTSRQLALEASNVLNEQFKSNLFLSRHSSDAIGSMVS